MTAPAPDTIVAVPSSDHDGPRAARRAALRAGLDVLRGTEPPRYAEDWFGPFDTRIEAILNRPGVTVLDVGSGRRPTIPPDRRPPGCHYIGLDVSRQELERAPHGAYDEIIVGDAAEGAPALAGRVDLIVSFYVFEHIERLDLALEQLRSCLKPGGRLVAVFSGKHAAFAILKRLIPERLGSWLVWRVMGQPRDAVFPAFYTGCTDSALRQMLSPWSAREIVGLWRGSNYFRFLRPLAAMYVTYEEWAMRSHRRNLAPYYLVSATR